MALGDTFHRQVEKYASRVGSDIEVINLGVGGYGTLQELLAFWEVGQSYAPDLVLLGFYILNDVKNNSYELESIWHPQDNMKVQSRPFLEAAQSNSFGITQVDFEGARSRYTAAKAQRTFFQHQWAKQLALVRVFKRATWKIGGMTLAEQDRRDLAFRGVHYCTEAPEYTRAWDITKRILARLKNDTEAKSSKLIVFSVPALEEVSIVDMESVEAANPNKLCLKEVPGYGRLKGILKGLEIDFVDLLPDFRQAMKGGSTFIFRRSDRHWNPEGHALAAKRVVSALIEKHLIPLQRSEATQKNTVADARSSHR